MNKRQKKKLDKKLGCRSYADYRLRRIMKAVRNHYDIGSNDILYIVESKRGKYKCPLKVQLFKDCYPKAMLTNARGNEAELSFTYNNPSEMLKPYTDTLNALSSGDSIMTQFYRAWMNGVSEPKENNQSRHELKLYGDLNENDTYFIGVVASDGLGDPYAFTVVHHDDLAIVAEYETTTMTVDQCLEFIKDIITRLPKSLFVILRNRNGGAIIDGLREADLTKHIYSYTVHDVEYFGIAITPKIYDRMYDMVNWVFDNWEIVPTDNIRRDISNLKKINGKMQPGDGTYGRSLISFLLITYMYYYCEWRLNRRKYLWRENHET